MPLAGCSLFHSNVKGGFVCSAPRGTCAPSTTIDDSAIHAIDAEAEAKDAPPTPDGEPPPTDPKHPPIPRRRRHGPLSALLGRCSRSSICPGAMDRVASTPHHRFCPHRRTAACRGVQRSAGRESHGCRARHEPAHPRGNGSRHGADGTGTGATKAGTRQDRQALPTDPTAAIKAQVKEILNQPKQVAPHQSRSGQGW
jgi:hypothetical protein